MLLEVDGGVGAWWVERRPRENAGGGTYGDIILEKLLAVSLGERD